METPPAVELARSVFLRWERLRLPYNLVLAAFTLWWHHRILQVAWAWLPLAFCALAANACFLAAPLVETYLTWLGFRSRWTAPVLFTGGVLLSIPLVYLFPLFFMH